MYTLLICDDELRIREVISEYARLYDYNVLTAADGYAAIDVVSNNSVDCVILDIMMPRMNGFDACHKIKAIKDIPVIMLSARSEEEDKLLGFNKGIDDYVTKPFSPSELMARVKAIIQRYNKVSAKDDIFIIDNLCLNKIQHQVTINNKLVKLTNKEFELLYYFIINQNRVISREELINNVWGNEFDGIDRTVDAHIKMLRKSISPYTEFIQTVRGVGYKFVKK